MFQIPIMSNHRLRIKSWNRHENGFKSMWRQTVIPEIWVKTACGRIQKTKNHDILNKRLIYVIRSKITRNQTFNLNQKQIPTCLCTRFCEKSWIPTAPNFEMIRQDDYVAYHYIVIHMKRSNKKYLPRRQRIWLHECLDETPLLLFWIIMRL